MWKIDIEVETKTAKNATDSPKNETSLRLINYYHIIDLVLFILFIMTLKLEIK